MGVKRLSARRADFCRPSDFRLKSDIRTEMLSLGAQKSESIVELI